MGDRIDRPLGIWRRYWCLLFWITVAIMIIAVGAVCSYFMVAWYDTDEFLERYEEDLQSRKDKK